MFGPESIPGWNVEEGAGASVTGVGTGGGVVEPPEPPAVPEPELPEEVVPEPLEGGEVVPVGGVETGAGATILL